MLHKAEVGKLFLADRTKYEESSILEYTQSGPMLIISANNLAEVVKAFEAEEQEIIETLRAAFESLRKVAGE